MSAGPENVPVIIDVERCADGRLRSAYPVGAHDVEIRITGAPSAEVLTDTLAAATSAVLDADPQCRRVVFAVTAGDESGLAAAKLAGFRHVVDVDVPGRTMGLLVVEPAWVTMVDIDIERVPGT
ncbi:hypothetical protein [Nocardia lijiangensis]|uniref:hypothetical protein n=1 Tax=Nocardia lijiangensis TaxID=299618 RepID=UPI000A05DBFF|nr:hypothetical protein [Nocardia lijiangensis]